MSSTFVVKVEVEPLVGSSLAHLCETRVLSGNGLVAVFLILTLVLNLWVKFQSLPL